MQIAEEGKFDCILQKVITSGKSKFGLISPHLTCDDKNAADI